MSNSRALVLRSTTKRGNLFSPSLSKLRRLSNATGTRRNRYIRSSGLLACGNTPEELESGFVQLLSQYGANRFSALDHAHDFARRLVPCGLCTVNSKRWEDLYTYVLCVLSKVLI